MRINAKVIGALTAVALAINLLVPNLFYAALPLLILAACPLSMFLMMRMMSGAKMDEGEPRSTAVAPAPDRMEEGQ